MLAQNGQLVIEIEAQSPRRKHYLDLADAELFVQQASKALRQIRAQNRKPRRKLCSAA